MYAYTGILTALLQRQRTGEGCGIEVSMLEALGEWMGYPLHYTRYGGTAPARAGASHATIAPYGPFTACDGVTINLGLQNEREWRRFCEVVLEKPGLADDSRFADNASRVASRAELDAIIADVFATLDSEEAVQRLDAASIAYARQRTVAEFAEHPQLRARDRWRPLSTPAGEIESLVPPVTVSGNEPVMRPVPALGEHTESVLAWLDEQ